MSEQETETERLVREAVEAADQYETDHPNEELPLDSTVRALYTMGAAPDDGPAMNVVLRRREFDRWLAAHDAGVRADAERELSEKRAELRATIGRTFEQGQRIIDLESEVTEAREAGCREGLAQGWDECATELWNAGATDREALHEAHHANPYREAGDDE